MQVRVDFNPECGGRLAGRSWWTARVSLVLVLGVALCALVFGCAENRTEVCDEDVIETAQQTAKRIRAEWSEEIRYASPIQRVRLLHSMWLKVTASYITLGHEAVAKWRYLESVNEVPVCASKIKEMLDGWMLTEKPVFSAYEDNIVGTLREIESSRYFEHDFLETIRLLGTQYERVCKVAFNPVGSSNDYENALQMLELETSKVSDRVKQAVQAL